MARLTAGMRRTLPKSDFAVPSKAPGQGSYPIPDKAHAAVAKGRAKEFASPNVEKAVMAKVKAKFPTMGRPPGREMMMGRAHQFGGWKAHNE